MRRWLHTKEVGSVLRRSLSYADRADEGADFYVKYRVGSLELFTHASCATSVRNSLNEWPNLTR